MKSNLQIKNKNSLSAIADISNAKKVSVLVPVTRQLIPGEKKPGIWDRIAALIERVFIALDTSATRAREMDEQIRLQRSEHYAKYGFHFRDRF